MSLVNLSLDVDERNVVIKLGQIPTRLRSRLHAVVARLTEQLLVRVKAAEPERTGALRRNTRAFVDDKTNSVRGRVRILAPGGRGHNVAAAALEYGAHRIVRVRAHSTHMDHIFGRRADRQIAIVDAYTRRANIRAQRFLRGPLAALRPVALEQLRQAIRDEGPQ